MSGGGGQALVGKWGRVPDGGMDQIFANWRDPQFPPPRKKTLNKKHFTKDKHGCFYTKYRILQRQDKEYLLVHSDTNRTSLVCPIMQFCRKLYKLHLSISGGH